MSEPQNPQIPPSPQTPPEPKNVPPSAKTPAWIVGVVLVLLGGIFLLNRVMGTFFKNWWALFILIPALGSLGTAYTIFRKNNGRFTAASRGPLVGGVVLLFITAIFIFDLPWGTMWPVLLIIAGVGVLLTVMDKK